MTQSEKRQVKALWESGVSLSKIYRMLPYSRYRAILNVNYLRKNGTLKPRANKSQEAKIKSIGEAWKNGTTDIKELSEMFGYSELTTKAYLSKSGVRQKKRPPHNYKKQELNGKAKAIMGALKEGKPMTKVAKEFGVSRQYVFQLKERLDKE